MNRKLAPAMAVIVVAGFLIYCLAVTLNYRRYSDDVVEELMYFPSGNFLKVASLGYESLVADLLWLKGIQYYGEHRRTDRSYPLAEHVFSTITDLDPMFVGAYRFGAFVLAQDVGQPAAGVRLIKKGMENNPGTWQLPFDLGFLYFMEMDDSRSAARFFQFAARQKGAPDLAKRFSAFAYRRAGKTEMAKVLWEEIYQSSDNDVMRQTAEHVLKSIVRDEMADSLQARVARFISLEGKPPTALQELVRAGLLGRVPQDPFGGSFLLDRSSGKVLATSAVCELADRTKRYVERMVRRYRDEFGSYPGRLGELLDSGLVEELPVVPGTHAQYDPETGTVEYILDRNGG